MTTLTEYLNTNFQRLPYEHYRNEDAELLAKCTGPKVVTKPHNTKIDEVFIRLFEVQQYVETLDAWATGNDVFEMELVLSSPGDSEQSCTRVRYVGVDSYVSYKDVPEDTPQYSQHFHMDAVTAMKFVQDLYDKGWVLGTSIYFEGILGIVNAFPGLLFTDVPMSDDELLDSDEEYD